MNPAILSALALVAAMFVAGALGYGGDGDLDWQRQLGEAVLRTHALPATLGPATFSAPTARWIPHEWIFAALWAAANRCGAGIVFALGCAVVALLTLVVEAVRSRSSAPWSRMLMLAIVAIGLMPSFGLRAQVLGWPLLALIMLALEAGPRRAWLALPLAAVWFNLHASALVAPCIVLAFGIGTAIEARRPALLWSPLALAGACALASLATPFGIALPRFIVAWSANPATGLIMEWLPAAPDKITILAGVLVIAGLLVAGELRGARLSWPQRLLALGLLAATLLHIRNLGLFCIVAGPWTAAALDVLLPRKMMLAARSWRTDGGLAALAFAAAIALVVLRVRIPIAPGTVEPAAADLMALHVPLRVACEDFSWCSRFAGDAQVRVLLDGRTDAYPDTVFNDYRRLLHGDALAVLTRWHVDAAVVHAGRPLARALAAAGWKQLRRSEPQVYLRPARAAARQIRRAGFGAEHRIADVAGS